MQARLLRIILLMIFFGSIAAAGHECSSCKNLRFIFNKNQWHSNIKFKADVPFGAIFLEQNGYTFTKAKEEQFMLLRHSHHRSHDFTPDFPEAIDCHAVKVSFVGANKDAKIKGEEELKEYFNYFIGNSFNIGRSYITLGI